MTVLVGLVVGVLLIVAMRAGRRRASAVAAPAAARPWGGPARLNGRPGLRLPRSVPTPVQQIEQCCDAGPDCPANLADGDGHCRLRHPAPGGGRA